MAIPFPNGGFETGDSTGWDLGPNTVVSSAEPPYSGAFCLSFTGTSGATISVQDTIYPTYEGLVISSSCMYHQGAADVGRNAGAIFIRWFDASNNAFMETVGNWVSDGRGGAWHPTSVSRASPAGAVGFSVGIRVQRDSGAHSDADVFSWNYEGGPAVTLQFPTNGTIYAAEDEIPLRATSTGGWDVVSMSYVLTNTATSDAITVGPVTADPWATNYNGLPAGHYTAVATATYDNGAVASSAPVNFTVGVPVPPTLREYKASNSYTYLIAENFVGLSGSIPPTAQIVGIETVVDYYVEALVRSKDIGITDPTVARYAAAFDMVPSATFETVLLQNNGADFSSIGSTSTEEVEISRSDYTVLEDGVSEEKRWTVLRGSDKQATIGQPDSVHGMGSMPAADIVSKAMGIRFYPNLGTKPDYADTGEAAFRVHIDKLRVQIYFDAGSVEYYFTSPDKTQVIKGTLTSYNTSSGNFSSADAVGELQLTPSLEIMDGNQTWIGNDWTIHAAYPPTDDNQIGEVAGIVGENTVGMRYNGLPTQQQVKDNRSRYQFVTENFYGSPELNSMYGVHGLPRAFAYNGDYFYTIHTQPDAEKDSPRSVANHHGHLALGYHGGRVDISVVGEPYNYEGVLGASSWAFGDKVVGLLPLSGTILGVFGAKSIWGISGTTVDNFATQVISPNIGAIEYTITDMGFPVYANAYGIYTLSQTQQYGDYLGQPMSKDISPWIRPRLLRKPTSDKEVVCAFPVRSKNQYRICFSDGYVASMTLNGQQMPTFSFQKYFLGDVCVPGWINVSEYDGWWDYSGEFSSGAFITEQGPAGGGWMVEFENPVRVRITTKDYVVSSNAFFENGFIINTTSGPIDVENAAPNFRTEFLPMPIEYDGVTSIYYTGAEDQSDATVESTAYIVEVWKSCGDVVVPASVYDYPSIVPAAVSSELDNHGEERIHIAPYVDVIIPDPPEAVCSGIFVSPYDNPQVEIPPTDMPIWWSTENPFAVKFPGSDYVWYFYFDSVSGFYRAEDSMAFPFNSYDEILHGEITAIQSGIPVDAQWSCLHASTYAPN